MRIPRFYLASDYQEGQTLSLNKEQAHYALTVLRLKDQRPVEVFNGQGQQAQAILIHTSRRTADLVIESITEPKVESPLETILCQGISKGDRMDYTIQKAVELGVTTIQPLFTEHCDVKLSGTKLDKKIQQWQTIAINACEQSGRNIVPQVLPALHFEQWLTQLDSLHSVTGLVLDPYAAHRLQTANVKTDQAVHLLIGPEGGLNKQEVHAAQMQGLTPIKLGPRILRTETAGLVVLSALQMLYGDL